MDFSVFHVDRSYQQRVLPTQPSAIRSSMGTVTTNIHMDALWCTLIGHQDPVIYWSKRFRVKISKMIPCSHELGQIHWPLERRLKSSQPYKWRPSFANYSLIKKSIIHDFNLWFMWVDPCCFQYLHLSTLQDSPIEPTKTNAETPAKAVRVKALVISRNPQANTSWTTYDWWIASKCMCINIYIYMYLHLCICLLWIHKYLRV